MRHFTVTIALCLAAAPLAAATSAPKPIMGDWITDGGKSIVRIQGCGANMCGRIVKILKPDPAAPKTDTNNPDPALRARPLAALQILTDFVPDSAKWIGSIYDPRSGRTYKSKASLLPDNTLQVEGCIAFFCQGQVWTRAPS
ncbi:DUF2147 domain-containing protein [Sphingomonas crocodyli]|uniref:DUF2147 domain-containing protein n=1 Tax=Sphingomonas crocodyli TaxID=1979270 RepID=UPI001F0C680A|nr:DUF2147 domain-containing protein [Sphingomonas crocodyli]